jgi:hypothetical protein
VLSDTFRWITFAVVCANIGVFCVAYRGLSSNVEASSWLELVKRAFSCYFIAELAVMLVGLGWRQYFQARARARACRVSRFTHAKKVSAAFTACASRKKSARNILLAFRQVNFFDEPDPTCVLSSMFVS